VLAIFDDVIYRERYIWAREKNEINKEKHHISFETASLVFDDPFSIEVFDDENSNDEDRYNVTGSVTGLIGGSYITVSVIYRDNLTRIFSARDADTIEKGDYNDHLREYFR
jgi:uncharacterized DUF497 family protein